LRGYGKCRHFTMRLLRSMVSPSTVKLPLPR
jgi:hypothetical protein